MSTSKQMLKQNKIRYTEYYDFQEVLDELYKDSKDNKIFSNLMKLITSRENIKLAYRSIKGNKGSHTAGVDGRKINHLSKLNEEEYISLIQKQFHWYKPHPVKRVEIPKPNGKTRPLGIPTIVDRIVQNSKGTEIKSHTYRALRSSKLKEIYIVRYADDFKIFCSNYYDAKRTYQAVKQWLEDRLKLTINEEKSTITNLKQKYSEFLGFKLKLRPKGEKYVVKSHISDKALKKAKENISKCVKEKKDLKMKRSSTKQ